MSNTTPEENVSNNAKTLLLAIIGSVAAVAGTTVVLSYLGGDLAIAEKVALSFISGVIGFGAGIVTALWGK